eukprot:jgi/Psemu1/34390/gm1.34390_g
MTVGATSSRLGMAESTWLDRTDMKWLSKKGEHMKCEHGTHYHNKQQGEPHKSLVLLEGEWFY